MPWNTYSKAFFLFLNLSHPAYLCPMQKAFLSILIFSCAFFSIHAQIEPVDTLSLTIKSQQPPCDQPLSQKAFKPQRDQFIFIPGNRTEVIREFVKINCLTAQQINDLALMIPKESERLDFIIFGFQNTHDPENFYLNRILFFQKNHKETFDDFLRKNVPEAIEKEAWNDLPEEHTPAVPIEELPEPIEEIIQPQDSSPVEILVDSTKLDSVQSVHIPLVEDEKPKEEKIVPEPEPKEEISSTKEQTDSNTTRPCDQPCAKSQFEKSLAILKGKDFSDERLIAAKAIAKKRCLSSDQVARIAQIFNFESTRLEFVKYSYPYTFDPENFETIAEVFSFNSSIKEFQSFLSSKK